MNELVDVVWPLSMRGRSKNILIGEDLTSYEAVVQSLEFLKVEEARLSMEGEVVQTRQSPTSCDFQQCNLKRQDLPPDFILGFRSEQLLPQFDLMASLMSIY